MDKYSEENSAQYVKKDLTILQRIINAIFPTRYPAIPFTVEPEDIIHINSEVRLSIADRFRILLVGVIFVKAVVHTENVVGEAKSDLVIYTKVPKIGKS